MSLSASGARFLLIQRHIPRSLSHIRQIGTVPLHESLKPLSWLLGTWESQSAKGFYPTIKSFDYKETLEFTHVGQPILNFRSGAYSIPENEPKHRESGFMRVDLETSNVAFMVAMNIGIVEIEEGKVNGTELNLESTGLHHMSLTNLPITTKVTRTYKLLDECTLEQTVSMATVKTPELTPHLSVLYKKVNLNSLTNI